MGQLTVRKLDDEIIRRLKIQVAEHGRSAEAEHREILKQVPRNAGGVGDPPRPAPVQLTGLELLLDDVLR